MRPLHSSTRRLIFLFCQVSFFFVSYRVNVLDRPHSANEHSAMRWRSDT